MIIARLSRGITYNIITIAEKKDGVFTVFDQSMYLNALGGKAVRTDPEKIATLVITREFIDQVKSTLPPVLWDRLEEAFDNYEGLTIQEAVDAHSLRLNE